MSPNSHLSLSEEGLHYYQTRYVADLKEAQPRFFVDAAWPGSFSLTDRDAHGHETIPALEELVREDYELAKEFGEEGRTLRIYTRRDK